jgi:hypothetical protein
MQRSTEKLDTSRRKSYREIVQVLASIMTTGVKKDHRPLFALDTVKGRAG